MRLQPYRTKDAEYIIKWIKDEREHMKWCANLLPYPLTRESLQETLNKYQEQWNQLYFTAVSDDGIPVGFCFINPKYDRNSAYMGFVIIDSEKRGRGYGLEMVRLACRYIFTVLNMDKVELKVYENNPAAIKTYEAAGFHKQEYFPEGSSFQDEKWGIFLMQKLCKRITKQNNCNNSQ